MSERKKDTVWFSTPEVKRRRKSIELTLSPEALERLEKMAKARKSASRSALVETLIMTTAIRPREREEGRNK